jgi:hypothetical protein
MPGLDPGIHHLAKKMDRRIKSGDDDRATLRRPYSLRRGRAVFPFLLPNK